MVVCSMWGKTVVTQVQTKLYMRQCLERLEVSDACDESRPRTWPLESFRLEAPVQRGGACAAASQKPMHVPWHQPTLSGEFGVYCWLRLSAVAKRPGLAWARPASIFSCERSTPSPDCQNVPQQDPELPAKPSKLQAYRSVTTAVRRTESATRRQEGGVADALRYGN